MLRQDARILSKHGPAESVDLDAIDLNSKEVKTYYRQCQKCWKRKADGVKLSVCSSCKITSYCSPACQRADWKFHKDACKANREYRNAMATQDELERIESYILGTRPRPSSLEVNTEMGEFMRRFRAVIVRASNRCFGVFQGNNEMWKTHAFIVRIERLENFPPQSRGWQRYRVVDAKARPLEELYNLSGRAHDLHPTLEQGRVYHEENVRVGCVGTITTFLECNSTGQGIQLVSWAGYSPEALEENDICEDWKVVLVESVEKASGRAS